MYQGAKDERQDLKEKLENTKNDWNTLLLTYEVRILLCLTVYFCTVSKASVVM